jgi:signal transduction histidine kinase
MTSSEAFAAYFQARLRPLHVVLDSTGTIAALSGDAALYGCANLRVGDAVVEALPFLFGLDLALATELPLLAMPSGQRADVVLAPVSGGAELLLVNATKEWDQQRETQQRANELHLLSTQQQRLLHELEETEQELRISRDAAEQASQLKSEFIAHMPHEFRTPLTAIIGHARRLPRASLASPEASIRRAALHLLNLVDNLIDDAQLRSGDILVQAKPEKIGGIMLELRDYFGPACDDKALLFVVKMAAEIPSSVLIAGVRVRVRQILLNVIGNAVKYTETGSVTVKVSWQANALQVCVVDQGPGISAQAQDKIFRPFWRESKEAPGAGLGLSITRNLVERMSGELTLSSTPDQGTTVTICLPAPSATRATRAARTCEVVLTEDSLEVAELLKLSLGEAGFLVTQVYSNP